MKYRTSLDKFIVLFRQLHKIPIKLPEHGYYSDEELGRKFGMDPRTVREYAEVLDGLEINGSPAYFQADSKVFYYRDDPTTPKSLWDRYKGWIGFFAGVSTVAVIGYVIHKRKHG
jgi:hypothetical protein